MSTKTGKLVVGRRYVHSSALTSIDEQSSGLLSSAITAAGVTPDHDFNVVRFDPDETSIALLNYPTFFEDAFPALACSWRVSLKDMQVTLRNYRDSFNPPVLHKKELMLLRDDPRRVEYERLTNELTAQGFFGDPVRIGFRLQWEKLLSERGFRVVDHQLVPIGNETNPEDVSLDSGGPIEIARHLTALTRSNFSAPVQILQRQNFLGESRKLFDYGCGKGDDVRGLVANGIAASGWDPHFAPESPVSTAEIVNLGFVINVIEDPVERREALHRAFSLASEVLIVSVMLKTDNPGKITYFGDGVLTSRSTFQKYYSQAEIREYIAATLKEEPIPVAPGIFLVFKDKDAEQRFQIGRYRSRIRLHPFIRPERPPRPERTPRERKVRPDLYELHRELLDPLWTLCLELGREPEASEIPNQADIEAALGSCRKAIRLVLSKNDPTLLEQSRKQRSDDIKVFLALQQFQKRTAYKRLDPRLQRDVKAFWGDYTSASEHGRRLLYEVAQPAVLDEACARSAEIGLGFLIPGHSLQLHSSLVPRLPPVLRVYVGCAAVLYGDVTEADIVKIHIRSGKVSFMKYDDFLGSAIPKMTERTKINLRTLDLQIFSYGTDYPCPPLYVKSRYINEEIANFAEQLAFDETLQALIAPEVADGYGPSDAEFSAALREHRWKVEDFRLVRNHFIPGLDDRCGRYLTYRQLIECGETQATTRLPNLPREAETYTALYDLTTTVLDPVIEYFGGIELTYGFCSRELAKEIPARIAPRLDQHAGHEKQRSGHLICARLGAAADFLVRDEDMHKVAQWIMEFLPFDRLYFYGQDQPLHVSFGPDHKREAIHLVLRPNGLRIPRPFTCN